MGREFINLLTGLSMKGNGRMMINMGQVCFYLLMGTNIKEILLMGSSLEEEYM